MVSKVFDYRLLRLIMGLIALCLPLVVDMLSSSELASISASYFTEARDVFVGLLFVVGAMLLAYRGHNPAEAWGSNLAAVAAIGVALFPTAEFPGQGSWISTVHYVSAILLFSILAWFCFGPFRVRTKGRDGKRGRRARVYFMCGCTIVGAMVGLLVAKLTLASDVVIRYEMTYWAEFLALWAFGIAWITAGKVLPFLVSTDEALHVFKGD